MFCLKFTSVSWMMGIPDRHMFSLKINWIFCFHSDFSVIKEILMSIKSLLICGYSVFSFGPFPLTVFRSFFLWIFVCFPELEVQIFCLRLFVLMTLGNIFFWSQSVGIFLISEEISTDIIQTTQSKAKSKQYTILYVYSLYGYYDNIGYIYI